MQAYVKTIGYILIFNSLFFIVLLFINKKPTKTTWKIQYFVSLIILLFARHRPDGMIFSFDFSYLFDWLKIILKNKTVFINVFGNVIAFIPLGFIGYKNNVFITLFYSFCGIILIELIQGVTRLGVFDVVDIVINMFGVVLGILLKMIYKRLK